jgi:hypothetical protein
VTAPRAAGGLKIKFKKRGVFLAHGKRGAKPPRLPRKAPQNDHKKPSFYPVENDKSPVKPHPPPRPNFFCVFSGHF